MEYQRTQDGAGNVWQWYDTERVMVLDAVTGEPKMFAGACNKIGTMKEALAYVKERIGWENRLVIVRLQCVVAGKVVNSADDIEIVFVNNAPTVPPFPRVPGEGD